MTPGISLTRNADLGQCRRRSKVSEEVKLSLYWISSDAPKKRKTALMLSKRYAFFPPLVSLTLIAIAGLSTQWLWFFNVTDNYSVDSMLGSAWTSSLPSGEIHSGSSCWLNCKRKKYHQWRLILPSAWRERARRPHVDFAQHATAFIKQLTGQKETRPFLFQRSSVPKMYYPVKGHTFRSKCTFFSRHAIVACGNMTEHRQFGVHKPSLVRPREGRVSQTSGRRSIL